MIEGYIEILLLGFINCKHWAKTWIIIHHIQDFISLLSGTFLFFIACIMPLMILYAVINKQDLMQIGKDLESLIKKIPYLDQET